MYRPGRQSIEWICVLLLHSLTAPENLTIQVVVTFGECRQCSMHVCGGRIMMSPTLDVLLATLSTSQCISLNPVPGCRLHSGSVSHQPRRISYSASVVTDNPPPKATMSNHSQLNISCLYPSFLHFLWFSLNSAARIPTKNTIAGCQLRHNALSQC